MAFWGIEIKPGRPVTHSCDKGGGRLRISQATLGIGEATSKSIVQCNVGNRSPVLLCVLLPNKMESCHLDLEFEEAGDVIFSVIGPRSVYLTGYYVRRSHISDPHSDTESYGVDIENTQTEGSNYCSDDDKYEDSFINDDDNLRISRLSPVLSSGEGMDEAAIESNKQKGGKGGRKRLKKRHQMIESDDDDANSHENEDEDDWFLSSFMNKKTVSKTTMSNAEEKIAQVLAELGAGTKRDGIRGSESKQIVGPLDIDDKEERVEKIQLDEEGTAIRNEKNELTKEVKTLEKTKVSNEEVISGDDHGNIAKETIIEQSLPMSNGQDQSQSPDVDKPKKKRKLCSVKEVKSCEVQTENNQSVLRDDQKCENNPKHGVFGKDLQHSNSLTKVPAVGDHQREQRLEETHTEEIGANCQKTPEQDKFVQGLPHADSIGKDLPSGNEIYQEEQNNKVKPELLTNASQSGKKRKKKMKKMNSQINLDTGVSEMTEKEETKLMDYEDQATKPAPIKSTTLPSGLIIEELAIGPPYGKVAAQGKKVKVTYTATLKDNGDVFDSNMGKAPYKFRLGDEGIIDAWNVGIDGMRVGDKRKLITPPSMAFGDEGAGEHVPPNSWIVYEIELVGVRK